MLGELDGEALVRALVDAGEEALDEVPGDQRQAAVFAQLGRVEAGHSGIVSVNRRGVLPNLANQERHVVDRVGGAAELLEFLDIRIGDRSG